MLTSDLEGLEKWLTELTGKTLQSRGRFKFEKLEEDVTAFVQKTFDEKNLAARRRSHARVAQVMLRVIDTRWMAYLQEWITQRLILFSWFGQRDPLVEYKTGGI